MAATSNRFACDLGAVRAAAERWKERGAERKRKENATRKGLHDVAETPERLAKWVNRRLRQVRSASRIAADAMPESLRALAERGDVTAAEIDNDFVERVVGETRDFLAVAFLERAVGATRPVCRLTTDLGAGRRSFGTGFLVSPALLLTNHHVLDGAAAAARSVAEFDFQIDRLDQPLRVQRFRLLPERFFLNDRALDYALVAIADRSESGAALGGYGYCALDREEGKIRIGDPINIVQHPLGEMKQVVVRENRLLDLLTDFAHYEADTEPGSSGSPVFNDQWEVVALHHSGVPRTNDAGQLLDVDGKPWHDGDDPGRLVWIANEGVRVSRLVASIAAAKVREHERALRDDLLRLSEEASERLGPPPGPDAAPAEEPELPLRGGDGPSEPRADEAEPRPPRRVTIELPLRISVEIGEPSEAVRVGASGDGGSRADEAVRPDPDYSSRPGFDRRFLGFEVPMPRLTASTRPKAAKVGGDGEVELRYHHFSTIVNRDRRLAFVSAVNYDPDAPFRQDREKDRWFYDPRIDRSAQAGEELYVGNPLDRGHLVRRADAGWGETAEEAKLANDDTFHFTNCSPQHEVFNQSTKANKRGVILWGNIEEHIAGQARKDRRRISIFNGPIFRANDRVHRGVKVPREYWKILAFENDSGEPTALGFILSQSSLIKNLPPEEFVVGAYEPYQVRIRRIEGLTGLDFGSTASHDPLAAAPHEALLEAATESIPLRALTDIVTR